MDPYWKALKHIYSCLPSNQSENDKWECAYLFIRLIEPENYNYLFNVYYTYNEILKYSPTMAMTNTIKYCSKYL